MKRILLALVFLAGCAKDPLTTTRTDNPDINVQFLFEHEGCRIYRFLDEHYVYYAVCRNGATQTTYHDRINCGKNCWKYLPRIIRTEYR